MSVQSEINRINTAKSAIATAITGKGVTVPDGTLLDGMAALIESIEAGGGGGSGGAKVVTGTFTGSSSISTTQRPVASVHGLDFRPKFIFVMREQSKSSLNTTEYTYGCMYDTANAFYRTYSGKSTNFYVISSNKSNAPDWYVTISDDGFDLEYKKTSAGILEATTYRYVTAG